MCAHAGVGVWSVCGDFHGKVLFCAVFCGRHDDGEKSADEGSCAAPQRLLQRPWAGLSGLWGFTCIAHLFSALTHPYLQTSAVTANIPSIQQHWHQAQWEPTTPPTPAHFFKSFFLKLVIDLFYLLICTSLLPCTMSMLCMEFFWWIICGQSLPSLRSGQNMVL